MKKHFRYGVYLLRHKWFVLLACWRCGLIWRGIVHDWSKFLPSEWCAYAEYFYGGKRGDETLDAFAKLGCADIVPPRFFVRDRFNVAWLRHQHRSPHHWQHWILREDSGATFPLAMPRDCVLEMLADWEGAGRAITGRPGTTRAWYERNKSTIQLHPETRALVERMLVCGVVG